MLKKLIIGSAFALMAGVAMAQGQNPAANPEAVNTTTPSNLGAATPQDQSAPSKQNPEAVNTTGTNNPGAAMTPSQISPDNRNPEAVNTKQ